MDYLNSLLGNSLGMIIGEVLILALIIALVYITKKIITYGYVQVFPTQNVKNQQKAAQRIVRPLRLMIWVVGLTYMIYFFISRLNLETTFETTFRQLRNIIVVGFISWLLFEIKGQLQKFFVHKAKETGAKADLIKIDLISK